MQRNVNKAKQVVSAWETLAPTKSFGGMTLAQFKVKVKPSLDVRDEINTLDNQAIDAGTRRDDADVISIETTLLVVNAVKGDPEHGEDGALYAAMGYIRKSDRQSGLSRKAQTATTPPTDSAPAK